jgi:ABC-2 type transport system ATP-binding protein
LVDQDAGKILLEGEILTHSPHQKKLIGGVFDISLLIEKLTAFEYLFFVAKMYGIPSKEALARISELLAFIEIDTTDKKLIEQYSKGMKAKLAFVMSIIHNPRYLFLDEPFDGIDEEMRSKIQQKIRAMVRDEGILVIITSHQRDLIENFCDIILTIEEGRIN